MFQGSLCLQRCSFLEQVERDRSASVWTLVFGKGTRYRQVPHSPA